MQGLGEPVPSEREEAEAGPERAGLGWQLEELCQGHPCSNEGLVLSTGEKQGQVSGVWQSRTGSGLGDKSGDVQTRSGGLLTLGNLGVQDGRWGGSHSHLLSVCD